jgi:hypothetical protein
LRCRVARLMPNEAAAAFALPCARSSAPVTTARSASAKEPGSDGGGAVSVGRFNGDVGRARLARFSKETIR